MRPLPRGDGGGTLYHEVKENGATRAARGRRSRLTQQPSTVSKRVWLYKAVYYVGATIFVLVLTRVCVLSYLESVPGGSLRGLPTPRGVWEVGCGTIHYPQCTISTLPPKSSSISVAQGTVCRLSRRVSHESETLLAPRARRAHENPRDILIVQIYTLLNCIHFIKYRTTVLDLVSL